MRLVTLDPGHFHAALVQKEMLPGVDATVHVYAPLGFDLTEHLKRIALFDHRAKNPTDWRLEVHASPDWLQRFRADRPGDLVVIAGRNRRKLELVRAAVEAGKHALVDKPWIIEPNDFPKLMEVVDLAAKKNVVLVDIMTERFEATNALQRELVNTPEVFGRLVPGTATDPGVYMENVHHFMKVVAGQPLVRPAWFLDSREQGEAMADTGTHLVDLVQWTIAPDQTLSGNRDVEVLSAERWPTKLSLAQLRQVTGAAPDAPVPPELASAVADNTLSVMSNARATYTLKGVYVTLSSMWDWQAPPGAGDWHYAVYRGDKARIDIRQGAREKHRPEVYVVPNRAADKAAIATALAAKLAAIANRLPGCAVVDRGRELQVTVPDALRTGHEAHFAEVTRAFLAGGSNRPSWEMPNLLTKYWTTTRATELSRAAPAKVAPRRAPR